MTSRKAILERQRAISAARNIKDSSFGKCVLRTNSVYDRLLTTTKTCLDHELKRKQMHGDQERKQFLNKLLLTTNPPSLIVERPPSPDVCRPSMYGGDWPEAPDYEMNEPRYMRPLKSRTRTPSNLPTIDAFKLKSVRKKINVWEDVLAGTESPSFKSVCVPSPALTLEQQLDLQRGWGSQRPRTARKAQRRPQTASPFISLPRDIRSALRRLNQELYMDDDVDSISSRGASPFINEIHRANLRHYGDPDIVKSSKNVHFSKKVKVHNKPINTYNGPVRKNAKPTQAWVETVQASQSNVSIATRRPVDRKANISHRKTSKSPVSVEKGVECSEKPGAEDNKKSPAAQHSKKPFWRRRAGVSSAPARRSLP